MPRATLSFELPEERDEFLDAVRGSAYIGALDEVARRMRTTWKYERDQPPKALREALDRMYHELWEIIRDVRPEE